PGRRVRDPPRASLPAVRERRMLRPLGGPDVTIRFDPTAASLLAALAPGLVLGCSGQAEEDPNPSGGGRVRYAARTEAPSEFLDAYAATNRFRLGRPRAIEVLPDGSGVLFLRSGARSFEGSLSFFDARTAEERVILTARQLLAGDEEELTAEERARRERMRLTASGIASFRISSDGANILVPLSGRLFLVDRARIGDPSAVRELESTAGPAVDPRFSPDGTKIGVVRDGDLYVIDVATGAERRLTTKRSDDVQNGLAEFVAQEEMGRMRGFWWSPDGASIAYQETDHAGMERMHILD